VSRLLDFARPSTTEAAQIDLDALVNRSTGTDEQTTREKALRVSDAVAARAAAIGLAPADQAGLLNLC